jgi:hypothetical protein
MIKVHQMHLTEEFFPYSVKNYELNYEIYYHNLTVRERNVLQLLHLDVYLVCLLVIMGTYFEVSYNFPYPPKTWR